MYFVVVIYLLESSHCTISILSRARIRCLEGKQKHLEERKTKTAANEKYAVARAHKYTQANSIYIF